MDRKSESCPEVPSPVQPGRGVWSKGATCWLHRGRPAVSRASRGAVAGGAVTPHGPWHWSAGLTARSPATTFKLRSRFYAIAYCLMPHTEMARNCLPGNVLSPRRRRTRGPEGDAPPTPRLLPLHIDLRGQRAGRRRRHPAAEGGVSSHGGPGLELAAPQRVKDASSPRRRVGRRQPHASGHGARSVAPCRRGARSPLRRSCRRRKCPVPWTRCVGEGGRQVAGGGRPLSPPAGRPRRGQLQAPRAGGREAGRPALGPVSRDARASSGRRTRRGRQLPVDRLP